MRKITLDLDEQYDAKWRLLIGGLAKQLGAVSIDQPEEGWMLDQVRVLTALIKAAEEERDMYAITAAERRTWEEIGAAMGTSRQAAYKRYGRFVRTGG